MIASNASKSWGKIYLSELYPDLGGRLHTVKARSQAVYMVLCAHASDGLAYPSVDTIAGSLGVGRRVVQMALVELVDADIVAIDRPGGGRKRTTRYRITPPNGARDCAVSTNKRRNVVRSLEEKGAIPSVKRRNSERETAHDIAQEQSKNRVEQHAGCSDVYLALKQAGVQGKALDELASLDDLTAADVRAVEKRAKAKATANPAGMVVRLLRDGERATAEDRRATTQRAWDDLGDDIHTELFKAVQEAEPDVAHCYGCMDTQRAMRKLARERGVLA